MQNKPQTAAADGFNLPAAYKSSGRQHDHLIAIASLIASVCVMSIVGANMIFG